MSAKKPRADRLRARRARNTATRRKRGVRPKSESVAEQRVEFSLVQSKGVERVLEKMTLQSAVEAAGKLGSYHAGS
jgi:hypothetical protein